MKRPNKALACVRIKNSLVSIPLRHPNGVWMWSKCNCPDSRLQCRFLLSQWRWNVKSMHDGASKEKQLVQSQYEGGTGSLSNTERNEILMFAEAESICWKEAFRTENIRISPNLRIVMNCVDVGKYFGSFWDLESVELNVFHRRMPNAQRDHWGEPKNFTDKRLQVRQTEKTKNEQPDEIQVTGTGLCTTPVGSQKIPTAWVSLGSVGVEG